MFRRVAAFKSARPFRGLSSRSSGPKASTALVIRERNPALAAVNPWVEQRDPAGSALTYYWNRETDETTALGASRPLHWVEVSDPAGSDLTYWWNVEHDFTTPLGAARPSSSLAEYQQSLLRHAQAQPYQYQYYQPQSLGEAMKSYFVMGVGMTFGALGIALVARLLA